MVWYICPLIQVTMNDYLIYAIGFLAPVLFFARTFIQWYKSEKDNKVNSPLIYWQISLFGAIILLIYGILRNDFAIILGQFIVYPVYIRNLQLKASWRKMKLPIKALIILIPLGCLTWLIWAESYNFDSIMNNEKVTNLMVLWGSLAHVVFTSRFVYQWIWSENHKESILPLGFWIISIAGSLMILIYAVMRVDPVFFAAHILGLFIYIRNIFLHYGRKSIFQLLPLNKKNKLKN